VSGLFFSLEACPAGEGVLRLHQPRQSRTRLPCYEASNFFTCRASQQRSGRNISQSSRRSDNMTQPHEFSVHFPRPLRGVVRAERSHPLPPPPAPPAPLPQPTLQPSPEAIAEQERTAFRNILAGLRKASALVATQHESMLSEMRQAAVELAITVAGRLLHDKVHTGQYPLVYHFT
jgi:hypothetical protein